MSKGHSAGNPGADGSRADGEIRTTLMVIERWKRTAADEVDNIGGWRDADPGDRLHKFWSDPARQKGTEHGSTMPRGFESDTTYLLGRVWDDDPKRDLTPLREVCAAISAWHADHSAERIPEQRVLVQSLEQAMLVVRAVESQLARRVGGAHRAEADPSEVSSVAHDHNRPAVLVPTPLGKLFEQFDTLLVTAGMLRREIHRLEQAEAAGELSEAVRRGWFPDKGCRLHPAESDVLRAEPHRDPVIKSIQLNRDLQRCGQEVFKHLPSAVDWLDDPADAAQKRWTVRVDADVRELLGCPYRGQPNDVEQSDLPWPDQGIVDAMWPVMERLEHLLHDLRSVERTRAAPIAVPTAAALNYRGDLDEAEIAALLQLGERGIWGVDELPETNDADMLRCLDRHGMVEARIVVMQSQSKYPGDKTPPKPSPRGWFSPIQQPKLAGDWDAVVSGHLRGSRGHPSQIRLSDVGKAERAKALRTVGGVAGGEAGALPADATGAGGAAGGHNEDPTEAVVENELDGLSDTTFLSESDLADRFNICQSTLRGKLPTWRKSHMNNDWIAVKDRRPKDPHFLYRVLSIYPLIEEIRRSRRGSA